MTTLPFPSLPTLSFPLSPVHLSIVCVAIFPGIHPSAWFNVHLSVRLPSAFRPSSVHVLYRPSPTLTSGRLIRFGAKHCTGYEAADRRSRDNPARSSHLLFIAGSQSTDSWRKREAGINTQTHTHTHTRAEKERE
ncbi:hypothetical protein LZ31DRAFT_256283 [Colletotrichum somersetense]|nr:hypothetical protein LZ31DRAFT_256283 [Colletotrichum somersetense]